MVSVAPLHRSSHFDPTEGAIYAMPSVASQVRVTASPSPSLFEILISDQISSQAPKNAVAAEAHQQTSHSGDETFTSAGRVTTVRAGRELTIADIQTTRLGFNFVASKASIEANAVDVASSGVTTENPVTTPSVEAAAQRLAAQELTAFASSVQRLLPQSMFAPSEIKGEAAVPSASSSESQPTSQQPSATAPNVSTTSASIPNSIQNATSLPAVQGIEIPRAEFLAASAAIKTGMSCAIQYRGVDQSSSATTSARETSLADVGPQIRADSLAAGTGQGQNSSERLATVIVDSLGQIANNGPSSVSIRLTLPELGIVVLYLSMANGVVSVRIGVKNSRAKRTLQSQLNDLRNSLIDRDVNCDECRVDDESDEVRSANFEMTEAPSDLEKPASPSRWNQGTTNNAHQSTESSNGQLNFVA